VNKVISVPKLKSPEVEISRRSKDSDRRAKEERRKESVPVAVERRATERRSKVQRRRQIDPTTCERDYSGDEIEFMQAMDAYKRTSGRMFPTCSEILEVIRGMGYVRLTNSAVDTSAPNEAPSPALPTGGESIS
jgi:hypothetical protein